VAGDALDGAGEVLAELLLEPQAHVADQVVLAAREASARPW
jgi:hypothetical protein